MSRISQRAVATTVIVLVLGLQFAGVVLRSDRWSWPFTNYPMYSGSHYDGDRVSARHSIYATTKDGREVEISPDSIGVNMWLFEEWARDLISEQRFASSVPAPASASGIRRWLVSTSLWSLLKSLLNNKDTDLSAIFLGLAEEKLESDVVQLRVEDTPYIVTRDGMAPAPPRAVLLDVASDDTVTVVSDEK